MLIVYWLVTLNPVWDKMVIYITEYAMKKLYFSGCIKYGLLVTRKPTLVTCLVTCKPTLVTRKPTLVTRKPTLVTCLTYNFINNY